MSEHHHEHPPIDNRLLEEVLERFTSIFEIMERRMATVESVLSVIKLKSATALDNENEITKLKGDLDAATNRAVTAENALATVQAAAPVVDPNAASAAELQAIADAVSAIGTPAV